MILGRKPSCIRKGKKCAGCSARNRRATLLLLRPIGIAILIAVLALGWEGNASGQIVPAPAEAGAMSQWQGRIVKRISFEGVSVERLEPLSGHLAQAEGEPLNPGNLQKSLRQVFATGLFETVDVSAFALDGGVALVFAGAPRSFIGTVSVDGATGATLNAQLGRASQLTMGSRFTAGKVDRAKEAMRTMLADNGFHEPKITDVQMANPAEQLVDITFHVVSGPQARIGTVQVTGDAGISVEEFRRHAHLRAGARIDHDVANRALTGVLKHYRSV